MATRTVPTLFTDIVPITPSDSTDINATIAPTYSQAGLYISGAGNLVVTMANGQVRTIVMVAGSNFYGAVQKVMAATTATGIAVMVI